MAREKLEAILDGLFSECLSAQSFLRRCVQELLRRSEAAGSAARVKRFTSEIVRLNQKRDRLIDTYLDGLLSKEERDARLIGIKRNIRFAQEALMREKTSVYPNLKELTEALAPLSQWRFWSREQKRSVLAALVPDIRVADYEIESLGLSASIFSNEDIHSPADSTMTGPANVSARRL